MNVLLEEDAVDAVINPVVCGKWKINDRLDRFVMDFEAGLNLVRSKTGENRFFISKQAVLDPEAYVSRRIQNKNPDGDN